MVYYENTSAPTPKSTPKEMFLPEFVLLDLETFQESGTHLDRDFFFKQ